MTTFLDMRPPSFNRRNALIDMSPINDAIDANRKNALLQRESAREDETLRLRRAAQEQDTARQAKADQRSDLEWFGKQAMAIDRMAIGPEREAAWRRIVQRTGSSDISPDEIDPIKGPKLMMAEAGLYRDPRADQMADLDLATKRAQLQKLTAQQTGPQAVKPIVINGQLVNPQTGDVIGDYRSPTIEKPTVGQEALDRTFAKKYEEYILSGGSAHFQKNLDQLRSVHGLLNDQSGPNLTGPILGSVPDAITALTHPAAVNARQQVEQVTQENLRAVLGGQFSAKEAEELIARAYNPRLPEDVNADRVGRLITAMERAGEAKRAAMQYFEQHGTMKGFPAMEQLNVSISDLERAIDGDPNEGAQRDAPPMPALGAIVDGHRFLGGNPADPQSWQQVR